MRQPLIIVGAGTEVCVRALLAAGEQIRGRLGSWPNHVFMLLADSDRRSQARWQESGLPADQVLFVPMSLTQVREAISWRGEEFKDCWRKEWGTILRSAPDNGACMLPALGRLMIKAARPVIIQHLGAISRRLKAAGAEHPQVVFVMNPVSGTSRGSILDVPRYLRYVFPDSDLHGLLIYPVQTELVDPAASQVFHTNFVEALRLLEYYASERNYEVYVDPKSSWEKQKGELLNHVFAFDAQYGNQRFRHLNESTFRVQGGLEELFVQVRDFLVSLAVMDREAQWIMGRMADVDMHRSRHKIEGHPTFVHSVQTSRMVLDPEMLRRAVLERALEKVAADLAGKRPKPTEGSKGLKKPDFL